MSRRPAHFFRFLQLSILLTLLITATTNAATHQVPKVQGSITPDGILNESIWQQATPIELKFEVQPGENIPAPVRTVAYFAYNKTHLLAAVKAYDPNPEQIRANFTDHDNIWGDDWCALIIDTFNDNRRMFDFFVNPFGVQADQIESSQGGGGSWDAIWDAGGAINDEGYIVEYAIPFNSMRFPRVEGQQTWGIDVVRSYPRSVDHRLTLFPRDRENNCYMCQSDVLVGFEGVSPGNNLEINPTVSAIITETRGEPSTIEESYEPGVTARWGFTPNLTASMTVNPDFSQVEADAAQLEINNQFALYFPESRPFFVEGAEFFSTRMRAVHTRSLADPAWGGKITGKEGANAIGIFSVRDEITNLIFPSAEGNGMASLTSRSTGTVARYRRDLGNASTLGIIMTDREGAGGYYNRLVGIDGRVLLTPKDSISFQALRSQTRYDENVAADYDQPTGSFSGGGEEAFYFHNSRNLDAYLFYKRADADLRADLGFITQTGYYQLEGGVVYDWLNSPDHWWNNLSLEAGYEINEMLEGGPRLHSMVNTYIRYAGLMQSSLTSRFSYGTRHYNGKEFDIGFMQLYSSIKPTGYLSLGLNVVIGEAIDFEHTRAGYRHRWQPSIGLRVGSHFEANLAHSHENFTIDENRLYTANVTQLKLVYQLNRRAFIRVTLQQQDYDRNTALYTEESTDDEASLLSQLLLSYKINPRTVLFLGYSGNHFGDEPGDMAPTNRTVFAKIGYAWSL